MPRSWPFLTLSVGAVLLLPLLVVSSCSPEAPTSPAVPIDAARAPTGPTVTSADPTSAPQNTTLDVRVLGTGYDQGSRAVWALDGDTALATTKVKTNSTRYVSSKELVANITIAADAPLDLYDIVAVTSSGKKGIGIERFTVTLQITDIGTLPNAWPSFPMQVSAAGIAVGYGYTGANYSGVRHALRWNLGSGTVVLEDLTPQLGNSVESNAWGLNEAGDIVGGFRTAAGKPHAFLLASAGLTDLHPLCNGSDDGKDASGAYDVNANGEVVGYRGIVDGPGDSYRAFYWAAGCMTELPTLGGSSQARAINDNGVIVGQSGGLPVRWTRNSDTPGGWNITPISSSGWIALAVNRAGAAVGYGPSAIPGQHAAMLWPEAGGEIALGTFGGSSEANGIGDDGTIVGSSIMTSGVQRAFRWTASTGMIELGSYANSKGSGSVANAIGGSRIVGFAKVGSTPRTTNETHATMWTGY
jgi:probable HAF family extracellular repeat protein